MLGRGAFRGVLCGRVQKTRTMATNARANPVLRPIHFEIEPDKEDRPFRIFGAQDVEVQDWEYPTSIEAEQRQGLASCGIGLGIRIFSASGWTSLTKWNQENVSYTSDGIVKGPEGHDVMVIEPCADGSSLAFFNLCDNPAMVELVQAIPEIIQEFEDDNKSMT
ncbi:hypothetical protein PsorP6_005086 [Peronosclerospora sorghi]|uniref:Uncharacterized protein n=1 Tax=Peronosclerospora sorghi TaxID=230839 RepID=A0ACC0W7V1_9STRA|nr:hypothetical protein PsorP6_005086 [Peronosclerospora sorghi]